MPSEHYTKMARDLKVARKICYKVPISQCNTEIQDLKVKSFILLSHAILEEYIENIVLHVASEAIRQLAQNSTITTAAVGLISSGLIGRIEQDGISRKLKRQPFEDINLFANTAYGRFIRIVRENNGIKRNDQLKLLLPVGVDPETEDPVTMAALDSFGGKRGDVAHQFKISKTHTLSEIEGELSTIQTGLASYDAACLGNV